MNKWIALSFAVLLSGCHYTPPVYSVFGSDGKAYTAPSLCAALTLCLNSNSTPCYEPVEVEQTQTAVVTDECKPVTK